MRKVQFAFGIFLAAGFAFVPGAGAAEYFVPQGHSYSPGHENLPPLNSRRDQIQARADEIEAEIYQRQLRQRRFIEQLNSFEDHVFGDNDRRGGNW